MSDETTWEPGIRSLLDHMLKVEASDLYLTVGSPPMFRIDGVGYPAKTALTASQIDRMGASLMTPAQQAELADKLELNLALANSSGGRFRVNMLRQRGAPAMVIRLVHTKIRTLDELLLPPVLAGVMRSKRGLVLVVGGTGSGKSTTLAAMIDHRNRQESGHIITIEDPIEFIHPHHTCIVTQREVGIDTLSYKDALKNALRQAPDVILIGEIRDAETMESAIAFAETGHLCVSTLHSNNADQAIERILNFFPPTRQHEIRLQLSLNLRAIISQRLVASPTGGREAALEILLDTPRIRDLIKRGETESLKEAMEQGTHEGCQTFDSALCALVEQRRISPAVALRAADSPNNLRLRLERLERAETSVRQGRPLLRLVPAPAPTPVAGAPAPPRAGQPQPQPQPQPRPGVPSLRGTR
ncbi:MAG: PilT/PilU family type 4a pilus ATPase [Myxococcales bacterium]|nr:PilT/PilU family type 4a pilus ATPase [Myxococcales bacterium]